MNGIAVTLLTLLASTSVGACSAAPATASPTDASSPPPEGHFPCDVGDVIKGWCVRCHSDPPVMNAPFPLTTYADTQADLPYTAQHIWMDMKTELTPTVSMPPNAPYLTDAGLHTLLDWIDAGAPPGASACD